MNNKKYFRMASALSMLFSAFFRIYYYVFIPNTTTDFFSRITYLALPLFASFAFIFIILAYRDFTKNLVIPVAAGVLFFIIKSFDFDSALHTSLCIILYLVLLAVYTLYALGRITDIRVPLLSFALPLVVHIGMDIYELICADRVVLQSYFPEFSVLLMLVAILASLLARPAVNDIAE